MSPIRNAATVGHLIGAASRVEFDYFCRRCKGHFSSTVEVTAMGGLSCRCGSHDLLIYSLVGDLSSPLRRRAK